MRNSAFPKHDLRGLTNPASDHRSSSITGEMKISKQLVRKLTALLACALGFCLIAGCGNYVSMDDPQAASASQDFSVSRLEWGIRDGRRVLRGSLKNNTKKQYSYAEIEINLYDWSGAQVDSDEVSINNLEPNGTWSFELKVFDDRAANARVKGVLAF